MLGPRHQQFYAGACRLRIKGSAVPDDRKGYRFPNLVSTRYELKIDRRWYRAAIQRRQTRPWRASRTGPQNRDDGGGEGVETPQQMACLRKSTHQCRFLISHAAPKNNSTHVEQ